MRRLETIGLDALGRRGGENGTSGGVGQNGFPSPWVMHNQLEPVERIGWAFSI